MFSVAPILDSKEEHVSVMLLKTGPSFGKPFVNISFIVANMVGLQLDQTLYYGILKVYAEDKVGGQKKEITITCDKQRLSNEAINKPGLEIYIYENKPMTQDAAKNALMDYAYYIRNKIKDKIVASKIHANGKKKLRDAVDEALKWLDLNSLAKVEEYKEKMKELEHKVQLLERYSKTRMLPFRF
ncbi:heat shock cognate 70 kDa protein [Tanacetum coccineum]